MPSENFDMKKICGTIAEYMLRRPLAECSLDDEKGFGKLAKVVGWQNMAYSLWSLEDRGVIERVGLNYRLKDKEKAIEIIV